MAGGNFLTMNKKLPGAYINFKSVPNAAGTVGERGIATMPLALEWGPEGEVIELLSTDLEDGSALTKVGCTAFDADSLILRECLKHCYKLLLWRIDKGATKATHTADGLTVSAKYGGLKGNNIQIAIVENGNKFDVVTFYQTEEQDRQTVAAAEELLDNDWVDFTGTGELTASAGAFLTGGTTGTISASNYTDYFAAMKLYSWHTMGLPSSDKTLPPIAASYIKGLRDDAGKKVQAVVYDYNAADYEGVISCKQGYQTETETISPVNFVAWVTGATAGANVNESLCYKTLEGATAIIGDLPENELEEEIQKGWFLLGKRVDGVIVVLDDLNTFVSYTAEKDEDFANNRVIRVLDEIGLTTQLQFEKMFIGKVDNTETGRDIFKSQLIANFTTLQDISAITNFVSDDLEVLPGTGKADVKVNAYIQPVDCMKKLYMTVFER